jgi:L,D-transpeptidase-like protein
MSSIQIHTILGTFGAVALLGSFPARAQGSKSLQNDLARVRTSAGALDTTDTTDADSHVEYSFTSKSDSLSWARNRGVAARSNGFRIVVSLQDRHLWTIVGKDTVLSAPVAVAKGTTLKYGSRKWTFTTPRGIRTVLGKESDPIWQPPEWLYAETANEYDLKLGHLYNGSKIKLSDGRILTVRDGEAGVIDAGQFAALPTDEHIVFDNTLYVPPGGSKNRKVEGELGKYRLILGEGYLLHGTPYKESIGMAATHGCIRMRDEDIEWMYDHVPVGTKVYIY